MSEASFPLVVLYINTVDIGLFGTGTQESRVTYNLIPSGDNIILAVGEVVTTINNQTGARQTYPVGNAITELGFLQEIKAYFTAWENALIKIFENKYSKIEALNLAKEYVALTQGAIMMMNLYDSSENYLKVGEKIISLI